MNDFLVASMCVVIFRRWPEDDVKSAKEWVRSETELLAYIIRYVVATISKSDYLW